MARACERRKRCRDPWRKQRRLAATPLQSASASLPLGLLNRRTAALALALLVLQASSALPIPATGGGRVPELKGKPFGVFLSPAQGSQRSKVLALREVLFALSLNRDSKGIHPFGGGYREAAPPWRTLPDVPPCILPASPTVSWVSCVFSAARRAFPRPDRAR